MESWEHGLPVLSKACMHLVVALWSFLLIAYSEVVQCASVFFSWIQHTAASVERHVWIGRAPPVCFIMHYH